MKDPLFGPYSEIVEQSSEWATSKEIPCPVDAETRNAVWDLVCCAIKACESLEIIEIPGGSKGAITSKFAAEKLFNLLGTFNRLPVVVKVYALSEAWKERE